MILAVSMTFIDQTIPYIAIGRTLLYFDLQVSTQEAPAKRWRERLPRRKPGGKTAPEPAR